LRFRGTASIKKQWHYFYIWLLEGNLSNTKVRNQGKSKAAFEQTEKL